MFICLFLLFIPKLDFFSPQLKRRKCFLCPWWPSISYSEQLSLSIKMRFAPELKELRALCCWQIEYKQPFWQVLQVCWWIGCWCLNFGSVFEMTEANLVSCATPFPRNNMKREVMILCWGRLPTLSFIITHAKLSKL